MRFWISSTTWIASARKRSRQVKRARGSTNRAGITWGVLAFGLAVLWFVVWPEEHLGAGIGSLQYALIRWGHGVAWVFLSAMFFAKSSGSDAAEKLSSLLGTAGGISYAAFLLAYVLAR